MPFETPIVLCVFNRPDLAERILNEIAKQRPRNLLIFSDGPRHDREGEAEKVEQSRRLIERVDWNCNVRTDFSSDNLGCKRRVASGISWALSHYDRMIFLEDDCLPARSFFAYCEQLLDLYEQNEHVMSISGDNFQPSPRTPYTYYFSKFAHCWGWATWRNAWERLDLDLSSWPEVREATLLDQMSDGFGEVDYWRSMFDLQYQGKIDSWAFPWMYSCWVHQGLTALPNVNLVSNIGFGADATHTTRTSRLANLPTYEISSWSHPPDVQRNNEADLYSYEQLFKPTMSEPKSGGSKRWWNRFVQRRSA